MLGGLSGDATISAWVDLDSTSNNQMMLGAGSDKDNFFVMALNDAFRSGLNVEGSGEQRMAADSGVPAGTWAYVSYVQKGTAASLYVNGKKVATGAADHSLAAAVAKAGAFVHLGGIDFWVDPYFDGRISSLAVYDKALDADAIAAEMKRTDARLADEVARAETVLDAGGLSVDQARAHPGAGRRQGRGGRSDGHGQGGGRRAEALLSGPIRRAEPARRGPTPRFGHRAGPCMAGPASGGEINAKV